MSTDVYPRSPPEAYLGDGLYASFDGFQIKLRAPREHGNHEVFLEPEVLAELNRWAALVGATR